jgi:hypothetical protein
MSALAAGCSLLVPLDGSVGDASTPSDDGPAMIVGDASDAGDAGDAMAELGAPLKPCAIGGGMTGLCAPYPPDGWAGPLIFYEGPAADPVQACASGYAPSCNGCTLHASPSGDPAACAPCSCDSSNVVCGEWLTDVCGSMEGGAPYPNPGCYGPVTPDQYFAYAAPVGTCNASGGEATLGPPWGQTVTACSPTATLQPGSCAPGEWCLAPPPPPFPQRFCVSQPGTLACPGGTYAVPFTTFQDASDTRACTTCSCGPPQSELGMKAQGQDQPLQCYGSIEICEDDACSQGCTSAGCQSSGGKYVKVDVELTPSEAGCEPEGGERTGQLEPTGPITFCCSQ